MSSSKHQELTTQTRFVRTSTIARNTGFTLRTVRKHIKAGDLGPAFFLWGEWCCAEEGYLAWLRTGMEVAA